jgi:hypothetical protein
LYRDNILDGGVTDDVDDAVDIVNDDAVDDVM